MLERLRYYAPYAWRFTVTRDPGLLICGLAITDRCNLHCRGCHVSNTGPGDLSYDAASAIMQSSYDRGCREMYFTGGEPMLWRDGERSIEDAISAARDIGYFHIHVYTNGTLGLGSSADLMWVSVDGLPDTYRTRRGDHFDQVEAAIRAPGNPPTAIIYTIDRFTASGVEPFLRWIVDTRLPVLGVMVYFHTPVLRQGRALPGCRGARGDHRRPPADEVRGSADHQLVGRPQGPCFGRLAAPPADRPRCGLHGRVAVLQGVRRGLS